MATRTKELELNSQLVPLFLARVRAVGGPVEALIARFALPADAETLLSVRLPLREFRALAEAVVEATADPSVGLHLGVSLPRGRYGLLEFVARSAGTIRNAFVALLRFSALINDLTEFAVEERGADAVFTHRIAADPLCVGTQGNEYTIGQMVQRVRDLSGRPFAPRRAWFAHEAPSDAAALEAALGTRAIEFGAGGNGFLFDASVLDWPLVGAEPVLHDILWHQADKVREEHSAEDDLLAQARGAIERQLDDGGTVTLERVAPALGTSARTLQRKLAERGTTFQDLLDELRQRLVQRYFADPRLGLAEIAFRLGYSDTRAFQRAFRRWTGDTPGAFRKRGQGAPLATRR
jgi:AraC-like DNA-binding protein